LRGSGTPTVRTLAVRILAVRRRTAPKMLLTTFRGLRASH